MEKGWGYLPKDVEQGFFDWLRTGAMPEGFAATREHGRAGRIPYQREWDKSARLVTRALEARQLRHAYEEARTAYYLKVMEVVDGD